MIDHFCFLHWIQILMKFQTVYNTWGLNGRNMCEIGQNRDTWYGTYIFQTFKIAQMNILLICNHYRFLCWIEKRSTFLAIYHTLRVKDQKKMLKYRKVQKQVLGLWKAGLPSLDDTVYFSTFLIFPDLLLCRAILAARFFILPLSSASDRVFYPHRIPIFEYNMQAVFFLRIVC